MNGSEEVSRSYEEIKNQFEKNLSELFNMDHQDVNYIDKRDETVSAFKEYKNAFLTKQWNPLLKEQKKVKRTVYFANFLAGFGLSFAAGVGIANAISIFYSGVNSLAVIIPTILIGNFVITKSVNHIMMDLVDNSHDGIKHLYFQSFGRNTSSLERILAKDHDQPSTDIIDVIVKTVQEEKNNISAIRYEQLYQEDAIFNLPQDDDYSYSKKF